MLKESKKRKTEKRLLTSRKQRQKREGGCSGDCSGVGEASEYTPGECPSGCSNHTFAQQTINMAKTRARSDAIRNCQLRGDSDCLCAGGNYVQDGKPTCETIDGKDGKECKYTIKYKYIGGKCSTLV